MKIYLHILILGFLCMACTEETVEPKAAEILRKSRTHLQEGRYDAARDSVLSMRKQYPTALESRAQGILLLDSIEMFAAQDSMDGATGEDWKRLSIKAQFFERKLQEDKKKLGK